MHYPTSSPSPDAPMSPINARSEHDYGAPQELVDALFARAELASRLDLVLLAEMRDVPADIAEIVDLMPPGTYSRERLCDQMNSIITAHGWGERYGTVS